MVATVSCRRTLKLVATHLLPSQNAGLVRRARHQHPCCSVCKLGPSEDRSSSHRQDNHLLVIISLPQ
ncbi:uncharacterized protein DS421_19g636870 [Arachis hypogaea]|uniref:Uncharacterized protein n=1 Tax=Arachis hypogaea TaxID=3818 RepID=A0A6B9V3Q3_ARAHY|nr:uncharacterized protein DS421_19g636870 [Arachis hypogaea]